MLLDLISDLHLDHDEKADEAFRLLYEPNDLSTVLVVAGDVYSRAQPKLLGAFLRDMARLYDDVVFVPGNHEYWGWEPDAFAAELLDDLAEHPKVHTFLTPHVKVIQGQRFLGGTMWYRKPGKRQVQDFVDFRQVRAPKSWFFEQQRLFEEELRRERPDAEKLTLLSDTIVVTHHLPTPHSTPPQFVGSPTDHFFMCNMESAIWERKPGLWLHGHCHDSCDYTVGGFGYLTRVVCWPRGYPAEYRSRPTYKPKQIEFPDSPPTFSFDKDEEEE